MQVQRTNHLILKGGDRNTPTLRIRDLTSVAILAYYVVERQNDQIRRMNYVHVSDRAIILAQDYERVICGKELPRPYHEPTSVSLENH